MDNLKTTAADLLVKRNFRLQQLAKTAGLPMATLATALGAEGEEAKPTARILLSEAEQRMLHTLCLHLDTERAHAAMREAALRDELDSQRSLNFALAVVNMKLLEAAEQQASQPEPTPVAVKRTLWQRLRS